MTQIQRDKDGKKGLVILKAGLNFEELCIKCGKFTEAVEWGDALDRAVARRRWLALVNSLSDV